MKTRKILSLISALVFALAAPASLAEGLALTDMAGREITLDAPATRVIALNPADCEILYALGAEEVLVGRGEYCNYPEAVLELPSVNSGAETNIEQILALEPDVIVMSKMAQTVEQVEALEAAGVRVVISDAQNLAGVYDAIAMLGELTGKQEEAAALSSQMQEGFDALREKAEDTGKTVYFEVSPLEWGLWTSGADTFLDELAQIVGLTNAFADVSGWARSRRSRCLARRPGLHRDHRGILRRGRAARGGNHVPRGMAGSESRQERCGLQCRRGYDLPSRPAPAGCGAGSVRLRLWCG